jgi:zinc/manganese transport system permease protein
VLRIDMTTATVASATIISTMLEYEFMRNAFAAAGIAAVVAGLVGYFLVLRGQTFAGHALSHIGFAGATGAVLIGMPSIWGLVGFTVAAGIGMGTFGERVSGRDVAIGVVLALALGLGLLFLHYYTAFATQAAALLFGNVLAVDRSMIGVLIGLGLVTLAGLAFIMRPLIFASLQPDLAEAKGVSLRFISIAFLAIVALAVSECAQIVGILLVFALMVGPPATAQHVVTGLWGGMILAVALALAEAWLGITIAYYTDWPVSPSGKKAHDRGRCIRPCRARSLIAIRMMDADLLGRDPLPDDWLWLPYEPTSCEAQSRRCGRVNQYASAALNRARVGKHTPMKLRIAINRCFFDCNRRPAWLNHDSCSCYNFQLGRLRNDRLFL